MRRAQRLKIQAIQKEQMQLVQIEKCLEEMLGNVNESINTLKVEELQLKSSLVEHFTNNTTTTHYVQEQKPTTSAQVVDTSWMNMEPSTATLASATAVNGDSLMNESINKQLLDLESLLVPMHKRVLAHDEEEEEDEDDIIENEIDDEEFLPE